MSDQTVVATIARDFTSTIFGNLSTGQKVEMTNERYEAWLKLGYVEKLKAKPAKAQKSPAKPRAKKAT